MFGCMILDQEQKDYMVDKFLRGSELLGNVVSWEETEDEIRISLIPAKGPGISVWDEYRGQVLWFNAYSDVVFIVFKKKSSLKALLEKNLCVQGKWAGGCGGKI